MRLWAVIAIGIGTLAAAPADAAVPVKPGMSIHIQLPELLNSCTLAFHYRAGDKRYASTAGHCLFVTATETEEVHAPGTGPQVFLTVRGAGGAAVAGPRIGRVVYAAQQVPVAYPNPELPDYMDVGLIELDDGVEIDAAMCLFGGPTGMRKGPVERPEILHLYGAGNLTGFNRESGTTLLPGRSGLADSTLHPNVVAITAGSSGGDSGSPLVDSEGRAVALLTGPYQPRIEVSLARAEQRLGVDFELLTAPRAAGAPAFGVDPACVPPDL